MVLGGAELTLKSITHGMAERGHEVVVVSLSQPEAATWTSKGLIEDIRLPIQNAYLPDGKTSRSRIQKLRWHFRDLYNFEAGRLLERVIEKQAPDVVSSHNLSGFSVSAWSAAARNNVPVVQVCHDFYLTCLQTMRSRNSVPCVRTCIDCGIAKSHVRNLSKTITGTVFISRAVQSVFDQNGYFSNASSKSLIYNSVDLDLSEPPRRRRSAPPVQLGFLGTVAPHKGIETLLKAFRRIRASKKFMLSVAGPGDNSYVQWLKSEFGADDISFLGVLPPHEFFKKVDVCVVPSLSFEPLGRVAIESLAFGVPVIASKRGGLVEIVRHGENGFLFDAGDAEQLAEIMSNKIDKLIRMDPKELRGSVSSFTSAERMFDEYETLYAEVTAEKIARESSR